VSDADIPAFGDRVTAENIGQYTGDIVTRGCENEHPDSDMEIATREDAHVK
jgi:hypothetical protein